MTTTHAYLTISTTILGFPTRVKRTLEFNLRDFLFLFKPNVLVVTLYKKSVFNNTISFFVKMSLFVVYPLLEIEPDFVIRKYFKLKYSCKLIWSFIVNSTHNFHAVTVINHAFWYKFLFPLTEGIVTIKKYNEQ